MTSQEAREVRKVRIGLTAGKAFIFDLEDVKHLRSLGIGGILTGTLPSAPQQNIFLGLPLQLMIEEVIWLVLNNHAYIVPDDEFVKELYQELIEDDVRQIEDTKEKEYEVQKKLKLQNLKIKNMKLNKCYDQREDKLPSDSAISQSLMISVFNSPKDHLPTFKRVNQIYLDKYSSNEFLHKFKYNRLNYSIFNYLKKRGYFLAPGLRFGGKFIGYPGDPLRYHAHLIINTFDIDQDIGMMNIVNGGRLATGVKKVWLIGSQMDKCENEKKEKEEQDYDDEDEIVCFSVEWAGFG